MSKRVSRKKRLPVQSEIAREGCRAQGWQRLSEECETIRISTRLRWLIITTKANKAHALNLVQYAVCLSAPHTARREDSAHVVVFVDHPGFEAREQNRGRDASKHATKHQDAARRKAKREMSEKRVGATKKQAWQQPK